MTRTSHTGKPSRRPADLAICPHCGRIFAPAPGAACPHCGYPLSAVLERRPNILRPHPVLEDSRRKSA